MELESYTKFFEDSILMGITVKRISPTQWLIADEELDIFKVTAKSKGDVDIDTNGLNYIKFTDRTVEDLSMILEQTYSITDKEFEEAEGLD